MLTSFLNDYPNYQKNPFTRYLLKNPSTQKIVSVLMKKSNAKLTSKDFKKILRNGDFLCACGAFLKKYGFIQNKIDFF